MIVCAEQTIRDFGVIVHEMGHLQYFMAYKNQPTIFQVFSVNLVKGKFHYSVLFF